MADTFREAAAEVFGVGAENIICVNGGDELLNLAIRAFCDENRPVAYPTPTYSLYPVLAKMQTALLLKFHSMRNLICRQNLPPAVQL